MGSAAFPYHFPLFSAQNWHYLLVPIVYKRSKFFKIQKKIDLNATVPICRSRGRLGPG